VKRIITDAAELADLNRQLAAGLETLIKQFKDQKCESNQKAPRSFRE
jgi:hypothetical protein